MGTGQERVNPKTGISNDKRVELIRSVASWCF